MQITKSYEGTVTLEAETEAREYSYGYTKTIKVYPSKVDTINEIIAGFLRGTCGVNAYYETRTGSDYPFLWIFNVPFLFGFTGTDRYVTFYHPLGAGSTVSSVVSATSSTPTQTNLFASDGVTYSFGLNFCGNPNTGFALRFKFSNSTSVSSNITLRFLKAENIINGADAVLWCSKNIYSSGYTAADSSHPASKIGGMNGVDMSGNNIEKESFSTSAIPYEPRLETKAVHRTYNDGSLPLVPLMIGPYRANGMYLRPRYFDLPPAYGNSVEVQPEVTIGGRSFLITNSDSLSSTVINMGLIETT